MSYQEDHSTMIGYPIQFLFPYVDAFFLHDYKQSMVLRKSVGQLQIISSARNPPHPERENGSHSIRLGFKWICIKGGGVIFNVEFPDPIQIMIHAWATKPYRTPIS